MKKVAIAGGGPSGLFLAILLRKRMPELEITVYEQNARDATYGFGVGLAEGGLARLEAADAAVTADIMQALHFFKVQVVNNCETPISVRVPGPGAGTLPRITLVSILRKHAADLGIDVRYEVRLTDIAALDADLVVGADGVNSLVRESAQEDFGTTHRSLSNHFAWFGTTRVFPTAALVFRKYQGGYFVAHYYPYSDTMSTFVGECDDRTWQELGIEAMSLDERKALLESVFAPELEGHPLVSNNTTWRQFDVIRNARWSSGRMVLIGDALSSAHPTIGSGTRIAMEDAIALAEAICSHPADVTAALAGYEAKRRPEKEKLIAASEISAMWYEEFPRWMDSYGPYEFVYRFMTRTGRIGLDRLRAQFPELMQKIEASGELPELAGA
jgi:2-polyprenyl-6-methoxyphenol hydroxylase-like FAD-dependent oxidoreductase